MSDSTNYKAQQEALIESIEKMYDLNPRVIEAVRNILRHRFVPQKLRDQAHEDIALPIGEGQTISQPSLVAFMTNALEIKEGDKVLEIGTGSGYQAAILGKLARQVITVERIERLAEKAKKLLKKYPVNLPSMSGIGYLEISRYLAGETSLDEAIQKAVVRTYQYSKRQMTWFKKDERIKWIDSPREAIKYSASFLKK